MSENGSTRLDVHALLAPQRALRVRFEAFRRAFMAGDRAATELELREFELGLRRRIEVELRVLQPVLARVAWPGRDARRELEMQYVQLRELTRTLAQRLASNAATSECSGFVGNLARRLAAHEAEMERVYYPAALALLDAEECRVLARAT